MPPPDLSADGRPSGLTPELGVWVQMLTGWERAQLAAGRSPESNRTRMSYLRRFGLAHPQGPAGVTAAQVVAWVSGQRWSAATRKSGQGALRSFYRWALREGHVAADPTVLLDPVKVPKRLPRPASDAQAQTGHIVNSDRRMMVLLAVKCGLRRWEIAWVRREDLTGNVLLVHGKGGKDRMVPLPPDLAAMIRLKPPGGYIFPGRFGGYIHPQTVADWIRQETGTSPHPLRHRFATKAYKGSKDLFGVQKVLGHSSPETTMVYTLIDTDDLDAVMAAAWAE